MPSDECDDKGMIADFIEINRAHVLGHHRLLRFFSLKPSRGTIIRKINSSVSPALPMTQRLALENFNAASDIRMFSRSRFSKIYEQRQRLMQNITPPWPSESDLDELVQKSSGSFIFAFTLVNFINDGSDLPHRKLQVSITESVTASTSCYICSSPKNCSSQSTSQLNIRNHHDRSRLLIHRGSCVSFWNRGRGRDSCLVRSSVDPHRP